MATAAGAKREASPSPGSSARRVPVRTCVACRATGGKRSLLRVVRLPEGAGVLLDPTGKKSGRGAYVCQSPDCVALALKQKKLERSLKTAIPEALADELRARVAAAETSGASADT